jgi:hypothetical protein
VIAVNKKKRSTAAVILLVFLLAVAGMQFVSLGQANPYIREREKDYDIVPPEGTLPPVILLSSPENGTIYASHSVSLDLNVTMPESNNLSLFISELYYVASWQHDTNNDLIKFPTHSGPNTLTDIPDGPRWLEVYAVASGYAYETHHEIKGVFYTSYYADYKMTTSCLVNFTIDTTPPIISTLSVENKTYSTSNVPLNILVNEPISRVIYNLDGKENITVPTNTTLTNLHKGEHNLRVSVVDIAGNLGNSETIYFTVDAAELSPAIATAVASIAVTAAVLAIGGWSVYLKKRKHQEKSA